MKKVDKFKKGKGLKPVTRMPDCLLKFKGKRDSKRGSIVVDTCIAKQMAKCAAIENSEVITAEDILFKDRENAAVSLIAISERLKYLNNPPLQKEENNVFSIRENRHNTMQINSDKQFVASSFERLSAINANIINIETVLDERIAKIRQKTSTKINAYVLGVRCVLKDYEAKTVFSDEARNIYRSKHHDGDEQIKQMVLNDKEN